MHISCRIKDHIIQYYQFFQEDWFVHRLYLGVSICKVKYKNVLEQGLIDFEQIDKIGYKPYEIGDIKLIVFYGSIDYQISLKNDLGIVLANDDSFQSVKINQKAEDGYYLLFMHKLENAYENTWHNFDVSYIPSIALVELGIYSIDEILFAEPFELTYSENAYYHTLQFTTSQTNLIPQINEKSLWSVGETYHTLKKLEQTNLMLANRVQLSLSWFLGSIESSNVNKLISTWIAIEALILEGQTSLNPIRKALEIAYNLPKEKIESQFHIGKIFRLRSNVVHKGQKINIPITLIEYLSCLYKDLLDYVLSLPCTSRSESYIRDNPHFINFIKTVK